MHDDLDILAPSDDCDRILAAYSAEAAVQKTLNPEHDGWLARVRRIDGIEPEDLPALHGQLIAHGLLKIQLAGREQGMRYQLSGPGKEQLARAANASD